MKSQVENLERFLQWLKSCPNKYVISSMSGGFIHVKFLIPYPQVEDSEDVKED